MALRGQAMKDSRLHIVRLLMIPIGACLTDKTKKLECG